jgi:hypothetical protein
MATPQLIPVHMIRDANDLSAWLDLRRQGLDLDVPTSTNAGAMS